MLALALSLALLALCYRLVRNVLLAALLWGLLTLASGCEAGGVQLPDRQPGHGCYSTACQLKRTRRPM